jgi:hypothetical protein
MMSEKRLRQLERTRRNLNILDVELKKEEWDLSAEQYIIEDFEKFYLGKGEPISIVKRKSHISIFDYETRRHVIKHYIVLTLKKQTNYEILKLKRRLGLR